MHAPTLKHDPCVAEPVAQPDPSDSLRATYGLEGLLPLLGTEATRLTVSANQLVLQEQDRLSTVLLLLEGVVKVRSTQPDGTDEVLGILGGGECIGVASLFGAEHAWGDVISITEVQLMRMPVPALRDLILQRPEAAIHLMAMMAGSLSTVRARVLARHQMPKERVLGVLQELARKACRRKPAPLALKAPMISQSELASLTGIARETCCRCLSKLQRQGVITATAEGWDLQPSREGAPSIRSNRESILPNG